MPRRVCRSEGVSREPNCMQIKGQVGQNNRHKQDSTSGIRKHMLDTLAVLSHQTQHGYHCTCAVTATSDTVGAASKNVLPLTSTSWGWGCFKWVLFTGSCLHLHMCGQLVRPPPPPPRCTTVPQINAPCVATVTVTVPTCGTVGGASERER
jgi:hypothetical protein